VFSGLEDQVLCFDCRPGPPTQQLDALHEQLSLAPTELLNMPRPEEHLAGPRTAGSQPIAVVTEAAPAPAESPVVDDDGPDTAVLERGLLEAPPAGPPLVEPLPEAVPPHGETAADLSHTDPFGIDARRVDAPVPDDPRADDARADVPRADVPRADSRRATRRAKPAAPAAGAPHRRALRRRPQLPARGRLKDDVQGPLIILAVLCAIVAVVGGVYHNSFLGLVGGLVSGAAIIAVIIIGLTSPK
jgi:hypothetical protein